MADQNDFMDDQELDQILAQMAKESPAPSDDLMARVLADAEELRPVPGARIESRDSFLGSILSVLGGWAGAGGLVTAGVVGLWIGISPPTALDTATTTLWDSFSSDVTVGWADTGDLL